MKYQSDIKVFIHKNIAINIDNDLSAELYFAYYMIWSFLITLIGGPSNKGAKSKRQELNHRILKRLKQS